MVIQLNMRNERDCRKNENAYTKYSALKIQLISTRIRINSAEICDQKSKWTTVSKRSAITIRLRSQASRLQAPVVVHRVHEDPRVEELQDQNVTHQRGTEDQVRLSEMSFRKSRGRSLYIFTSRNFMTTKICKPAYGPGRELNPNL